MYTRTNVVVLYNIPRTCTLTEITRNLFMLLVITINECVSDFILKIISQSTKENVYFLLFFIVHKLLCYICLN